MPVSRAVTVETDFRREGVRYAAAGPAYSLLVQPKRKNRWVITVRERDEDILDSLIMDPADGAQRDKQINVIGLDAEQAQQLRHLLIYAGLHATDDAERWRAWRDAEADRLEAERRAEAGILAEADREASAAEAVAAEIRRTEKLPRRPEVNGELLVARVEAWTSAQTLAVLDACERVRAAAQRGNSTSERRPGGSCRRPGVDNSEYFCRARDLAQGPGGPGSRPRGTRCGSRT